MILQGLIKKDLHLYTGIYDPAGADKEGFTPLHRYI
jgi:hypothetical protein